jgi:adenylate kinase
MICVLFGGPGSGKGTQAELLAPILQVPHISTGELLRAEAAAGSELGARVAPLLAAGELAPDELIEQVLERRLKAPDGAAGALLDGYPRTVPQAEALDRLLRAAGRRVEVVLYLRADEQTLVARLLKRAEAQHRQDDNPESIAERLAEYRELTRPVVEHYRSEGVPVYEIDGTGTVEQVHERITKALDEVRKTDASGGQRV